MISNMLLCLVAYALTNRASLNGRGIIDITSSLELQVQIGHDLQSGDRLRRKLHLAKHRGVLALVALLLLIRGGGIEDAHARPDGSLESSRLQIIGGPLNGIIDRSRGRGQIIVVTVVCDGLLLAKKSTGGRRREHGVISLTLDKGRTSLLSLESL